METEQDLEGGWLIHLLLVVHSRYCRSHHYCDLVCDVLDRDHSPMSIVPTALLASLVLGIATIGAQNA
jgi:hypothetical protein